jgi:hypothetical protein
MRRSSVIAIVPIITLTSLLSGIEVSSPLGRLKLIYVFSLPLTIYILVTVAPRDIRFSYGLVLLAIFYIALSLSLLWSPADGTYFIKHILQTVTLLSFGLALCNVDPTTLRRSHFYIALFLIASIFCFNVGWHIANGFYTGWKRLGDPKSTFSFLPMLIAAGIVLHVIPATKKWLAIWTLLCALILLSGERKAFVSFCLISAIMYISPKGIAVPVISAGVIALVAGPLDAATEGYISKQIGSILAGPDPRNEIWYSLIGGIPASMSDTARQFSARVAWDLFGQNPLFGAGPDATVIFHKTQLANYPEFLQVAVHNEFLRILAEYGLFGLTFFLLPITRSIVLCFYDAMMFYRRFNSAAYLRLVLIIFIPAIIYMWSEGSGIEMFALVVIVTVLPDTLPRIVARSRVGSSVNYNDVKPVQAHACY